MRDIFLEDELIDGWEEDGGLVYLGSVGCIF